MCEPSPLYGEWLPRRIIDIYAEQATRKGFKVLFIGRVIVFIVFGVNVGLVRRPPPVEGPRGGVGGVGGGVT